MLYNSTLHQLHLNDMALITSNIRLALERLIADDIVAIPTETVYGLAGNAESEEAVSKIYHLKNRPLNHPLIMHVAPHCDLSRWVHSIPDYAQKLIDNFWPGPLTLVFQAKQGQVSPTITGGQTTVAIRCPSHPITQSLLAQLPFPLVAPSANPFGKISPTTAQHVVDSFAEESLLVLDGGRCEVGIESTIVSAFNADGYQILRPGIIDELAIAQVLDSSKQPVSEDLRVPGRLPQHYQPEKPLFYFPDTESLKNFIQKTRQSVYILSFNKQCAFETSLGYHLPSNIHTLAYELYYQLRIADQSNATILAIELPPNEGLWQGIRERIMKAGRDYLLFSE